MPGKGAQEYISPQMEDPDAGGDNVARVSAHKIQKKDMPFPSQKRKRKMTLLRKKTLPRFQKLLQDTSGREARQSDLVIAEMK